MAHIIETLHLLFNLPKKIIYQYNINDDSFDNELVEYWLKYNNYLIDNYELLILKCDNLISSIGLIKFIQNTYSNYFDDNNIYIEHNNYTQFKSLLCETLI